MAETKRRSRSRNVASEEPVPQRKEAKYLHALAMAEAQQASTSGIAARPMPNGLSPEAQAAFLHGGGAASNWINNNASTLQAQYAADLAKQKEEEQAAIEAQNTNNNVFTNISAGAGGGSSNWLTSLWDSATSTWQNVINISTNSVSKVTASISLPSDSGPIVIVVIVIALLVTVGIASWEADRRHRHDGICLSGSTLENCFNDDGIIDFAPYEAISKNEFDEFTVALYQDIDSYERNPNDWGRAEYDTPFYDGNGRFKLPWVEDRPDNVVCIEGIACNNQSAVNYIGQGAYSAASGESLEDALKLADQWNSWYGHPASPEELYWVTFGYNDYLAYKQCEALVNQGTVKTLDECK